MSFKAIWVKPAGNVRSKPVAGRARWRRWKRSVAGDDATGDFGESTKARLEARQNTVLERVGRKAHQFDAGLDLMEITDRERPNRIFSGRAVEIGAGHLLLRSRRMCHIGRELLVAVHLVDSAPAPLCGIVVGCEYERDAMHVIEIELRDLPDDNQLLNEWVDRCEARGSF